MSSTGLQSIKFAITVKIVVGTHGTYVNMLMTCSIIAFNLAFFVTPIKLTKGKLEVIHLAKDQ
jgi:hypothetical protein